MKKLRFFDSLKFVLATVTCTFILNVAHADTSINSVIAYGKTEQSGTPTPTSPVPIMTNNGVLKPGKNLLDGEIELGSIDPSNGSLVENSSRTRSKNFIRVEPNTTYTFIREVPNGIRWIVGYNENKVGITDGNFASQTSAVTNMSPDVMSRTFTTSPTTHYIKWYNTSNAGLNEKVKMFQGTSADEVYVDGLTETIRDSAGHTATAQMLLGINDTYRDEQNINTGAITRKVGVKVLDGTENWVVAAGTDNAYLQVSELPGVKTNSPVLCSHLINSSSGVPRIQLTSVPRVYGIGTEWADKANFQSWLADQYANGTPVIVVYPLAESAQTTESVTTQTLNTAPVRQTAGSILGMPIEVVLVDGTREWVSEMITIATTKYNEQQFAPVQNELSNAMNVVDDVVTRTMSQAQQIDQIATNKQTRPDESCPPFKKCLLVEGEDGTPHWYEIYDPINDFLNPILAAAGLSGNQGAPVQTTHACTGTGGEPASGTCIDTSNTFFNGSGAFRKKYIDNRQQASDRPFGPATGPDELPRCADNATRTTSVVSAGLCYNTGGMFRELTEGSDDDSGEWAVVYNGGEGGASLGITPGVVYGIAKCTSVGQRGVEGAYTYWPRQLTGYSGGGTTLASLISEYPNSNVETVFNTLPSEYGTDEKPGYPRDNFMNCWCKMTAIGVPGSGGDPDQRYANGTIMSVSGGWVFGTSYKDASTCANYCAYSCSPNIRANAAFRRNVLTVR